ncbi:MAG: DUF2207 domain-containing protein [Collinsella sp.]|nr:DUF2207 domain-containing protein [Collinsella sp.]
MISRPRRGLLGLILLVCIAMMPIPAFADGFSMGPVDMTATIMENGDLRVSERRTFHFEDDVNGVFWTIPVAQNQQGAGSSIIVDGVSLIEDGAKSQLERTASAQNGDSGVYAVAVTDQMTELKVFAPHSSGDDAEIQIDYTLTGAVMSWADTAELYWKFVGPDWAEASGDVHVAVLFESNLAADPESKGLCRAWGHGPLDATVAIGDGAAGASVLYDVPTVYPGEFAEARIAFPSSWIPGLKPSAEERLPQILDEEQAWAAEANARRESARFVTLGIKAAIIVVSAGLLGAALYLRFVKYRSPDPVFKEEYFRDIPSDEHPAVISAFMNRGKAGDRALIATLMKLTDEGVVALMMKPSRREGLLGGRSKGGYRMKLIDRARATDPIDKSALGLFFGGSGGEGKVRSLDDLSGELLERFKAEVEGRVIVAGLDNKVPVGARAGFSTAAGLIVLLSFVFILLADDGLLSSDMLLTLFMGVVASAVSALLVVRARMYSPEAVELRNRCVALKRWLEDFTRLDEAVPEDVVLWDKLLVMAVALGVSSKVLSQLVELLPRAEVDVDTPYLPLYWWCYPYGRAESPMETLEKAYGTTLSEIASSSDSSGSGFGGGFSSGGGGGVGGGGGGTF